MIAGLQRDHFPKGITQGKREREQDNDFHLQILVKKQREEKKFFSSIFAPDSVK